MKTIYPGRVYGIIINYDPAVLGADLRTAAIALTGQQILDAWARPHVAALSKQDAMIKLVEAYPEVMRTGQFAEDLFATVLSLMFGNGPLPPEVHTVVIRVGPMVGIAADQSVGFIGVKGKLQDIMKKPEWPSQASRWVEDAAKAGSRG